MEIFQRDIWWANLSEPVGSTAGFQWPVVIVQNDAINLSRLSTYMCIPLTTAQLRGTVPWNMVLAADTTGLPKDSVAQTSLIFAINQACLIKRIGRISESQLQQLFTRLDIALGR